MTYVHRLQGSRFEFKYMIDETRARAVRDFARTYLTLDENADPALADSYHIHSIYLDSPALSLCQATLNGLKNRFKLRLRFYHDDPNSAVYFEIKRRLNDVICKERVAVRRAAVQPLLARRYPDRSDLVTDSAAGFEALRNFCALRNNIGADRGIMVSYQREAYVTPNDDSVRLTFDRNVSSGRFDHNLCVNRLEERFQPRVPGVILELKFTDRFPGWMQNLVQTFNLTRSPMAKYVTCAISLDTLTRGLLAG